jgi:hypothetical protein
VQIHYAVEARPYAWIGFAWMLSVYGAIRVIRHETDLLGWALIVIGMALAAWLHGLGLLYPISLTMGLAVAWVATVGNRARFARNLVLAALVVGALYMPVALQMAARAAHWTAGTWLQRPTLVILTDIMANLFGLGTTPLGRWAGLASTLVMMALAGFGALAVLRRERGTAVILACCAAAPFLLSLAISIGLAPIFVLRTLAPGQLPYYILLVTGLAALPRPWHWLVATVILLVLGAQTVHQLDNAPAEDWPSMAATLIVKAGPGDIIIALPNEAALPINYYLAAQGSRLHAIAVTPEFPALHLHNPYPSGNLSVPSVAPQDVAASLVTIGARHAPVVWLVSRRADLYDPTNLTRQGLEATRHRQPVIAGNPMLEAYTR